MFKCAKIPSETPKEKKVEVSIPLRAGEPTIRSSKQWILPDPNPAFEWIITSRNDSDVLTVYRCQKPEKRGYGYQNSEGISIPNELIHAIADAMLQAYEGDNT